MNQYAATASAAFSAYVRYLDIVSSACAADGSSGSRPATLAEWMGSSESGFRVDRGELLLGNVVRRALVSSGDGGKSFDDRRCAGGSGEAAEVGGDNFRVDVEDNAESSGDFGCGASGVLPASSVVDAGTVRGKHYVQNKRKREKARQLRYVGRSGVRDFGVSWRPSTCVPVTPPSSGGASVVTVDSRTAVEIEAAQTLAARRVAENKVAVKLAEHKLTALMDTDRTDAVARLAAANFEKKINTAKAQSQAAYKKCDESLKSLGSTGSAGEFALKQEVKRAKENEVVHKYVQDQAELLLRYVSPEVKQMVADMPRPVMPDAFEIFGDCPADYTEDERECYYTELNMMNEASCFR